jgi:hypothetical protein
VLGGAGDLGLGGDDLGGDGDRDRSREDEGGTASLVDRLGPKEKDVEVADIVGKVRGR